MFSIYSSEIPILNTTTFYPEVMTKVKEKNNIIWLDNQHSYTLIIPKDYAKRFGFEEVKDVDVEIGYNGLNIRKK